ncbi:MAG: DUF1302 family protein [Pseudohongiellaceae bacterium]
MPLYLPGNRPGCRRCLCLLTALLGAPALAQDFELSDDLFRDGASEEQTREPTSRSWLDDLTIELNHQIVGHLNRNRHETPAGPVQQSRGLEVNRLGSDLRYQHLHDSGWLFRASGRARMYLPGGYEHDNTDRPDHELRLQELYLQRSGRYHSVTVGRQTIVWGETVGNSVLDVINTTEYRDLTVIDLEDARRNQWMVNWDWFSDAGTVSTFVNLYPQFNPLPIAGSPLFPDLPWRLPTVRRDTPLFETGIRLQRSVPGSDFAVMAAWLYENDVSYAPPEPGQVNARPLLNDHLLLGFSGNRAMGRLLLTLDLAYSRDVLAPHLTTDPEPMPRYRQTDRLATSLGLEYALTTTRQLSISVAVERFEGPRTRDQARLRLAEDGNSGNLLLRYSESLLNENLQLSVTAQSSLHGEMSLLNLGAGWRINDDWSLSGQLILTRAEAGSPLPGLDEDVRLGTTVSVSF